MIDGMENTFLFDKDGITVHNCKSNSNIVYGDIYCYIETRDFFYIYLNKISAFMIDKNGMIDGSACDLRKLLQEKIVK